MRYPIKTGFKHYVTQGYGLTDFAKSKTGKAAYKAFPGGIHPGWDFGTGGINAPAISLIKGRVVTAKMDAGWGNHVEILGEDGWRRQYGHLSKISVHVGQEVAPFDQIGLVGTTGASTGIHLHYGKRRWVLLPYPHYEYADPKADFDDTVKKPTPEQQTPKMPKTRLIKGVKDPAVYLLSKKQTVKHHIPNWETLTYMFAGVPEIGEVDDAILSKIPTGEELPDLNK